MEEKEEEKVEGAPSVPDKEEEKKEEIEPQETPPSHDEDDPLKKEIKKIEEKKPKFTRRERLAFEKKKIEQQERELNEEEGIEEPPIDESKDTPVTVGMLEKRDKERAKKTAIELAENIEEDDERKLTIHYLQTSIIASGNPQEDLKKARAIVNSLKNSQIAEEIDRKVKPKNHATPPGSPGKHEKVFTPTEQERVFMAPPYNLTKEEVIKSREQEEAKRS